MKIARGQQAQSTNPQFVPHAHEHEPSFDSPARAQTPLAGYLKWFAERPERDATHAQARRLIAHAFNEHMASPPLGTADFGDSLVESLSAILHTDLRHRLTFNVKLCATLTVGRFRAHSLAFVLSEILLNALKHARPDGGRISLEIECQPGPNGETRLCVSDDGIGLPPGFAEWADGGVGLFRIRYALEQMCASLNLESDDLGVRFAMEIAPPDIASKATLPRILTPYSAHYLNDADNPHAYTPD